MDAWAYCQKLERQEHLAPALEVEVWKGRKVMYLCIRASCDLRSFCHVTSYSPELGHYQVNVTDEDVGHVLMGKASKWRSPDSNVKDRMAEGSLPFA